MDTTNTSAFLTLAVHEVVGAFGDGPVNALPILAHLGSEICQWYQRSEDLTGTPPEEVIRVRRRAKQAITDRRISAMSMLLWCEECLLQDPPEGFAQWIDASERRAVFAMPFTVAALGALFTEEPNELTTPVARRLLERAIGTTRAATRALQANDNLR